MIRVELRKLVGRPRTWVSIGLLCLLPVIVAVLLSVTALALALAIMARRLRFSGVASPPWRHLRTAETLTPAHAALSDHDMPRSWPSSPTAAGSSSQWGRTAASSFCN